MLRYAAAQTKAPAGIKLATMFTDRPNEDDLTTVRHAGVEAVSIWTTIENNSAEWMIAMRNKLEANGIEVYNIGILDLHCDPALVLSLPEAPAKIEQYKTYLGNLGRAGIHYTTYAHMSNIKNQPTPGFYATSIGKTRGNADTREFDLAVAKKLPCSFDKEYQEEQIWKSFTTFIRAVIPVAEKNKVRIGLHPDDPPLAKMNGVAKIITHHDGYKKAVVHDASEAAEVAAGQAQCQPERTREHSHRKADDQRHARAPDGAGKDVAAELVGAEPSALGRWAQAVDWRDLHRIGDEGRTDDGHHFAGIDVEADVVDRARAVRKDLGDMVEPQRDAGRIGIR